MQTFEYTVLGKNGKPVSGRIEAPDQDTVAARLRELGLNATTIEPVESSGLNREISFGRKGAKPKEVAVAVRQLATMVNAGLALPRALSVLSSQTEGSGLGDVLKAVEQDVSEGEALSFALAKHPRVFSPVTLAMVRAGEDGGFLDEVLLAVATTLEKEIALKRAVVGAMTYPVVVVCLAVGAVAAMLLFVVPIFQEQFEGLGQELPLPTQMLIGLADIMKVAIGPLVLAIVGGTWWWRKHRNDEAVRRRVDPVKLKVPIFGSLMSKIALSRFSGNLATMSRVGVPVVPALATVGATSGNVVVEDAVGRVREGVQGGTALGEALEGEDIFPPMLRQMVAVGEDSGALDTMLAKVSGFYDQEVETATASLTSVLEPLLIVVIGVIVGGMLIALYMPIFSIADAVQ
ncbi:type II secretion system F family protein [Cellulomonas sp. IC4_254]|uniref:type II secretion system F family protein n=1 Tax=Cellulomonas sp. IC4_254 TaxID=2714040 RepID=UPI001423952C|nr:type II secretion system F family protein [Cellulomonas sp. IC4_254]NHT16256.1 type II secretion system F family protein [Cellulomonas sp. IC4_254]